MIDHAGQTFGDLTVQFATPLRHHGNVVWECLCICGRVARVSANRLVRGVTKSCGCRKGRVATARNKARTKHGHAKTYKQSPTYQVWRGMIARCEDPAHQGYRYYGGRGVKVDPRWRVSFEAFLADLGERPVGLSLDRIDPQLDYGPGNCRWATKEEQAANRRSTRYLTLNGETLHLEEWCRRLGCKQSALRMRLAKGWPVERALTEPFEYRTPRKGVESVPLEVRRAKTTFRARYRHLYRGPGDDLTYEQWQGILEHFGYRCAYCGDPGATTMDHVLPIKRGGLHTAANVLPACKSCNSSKGARLSV